MKAHTMTLPRRFGFHREIPTSFLCSLWTITKTSLLTPPASLGRQLIRILDPICTTCLPSVRSDDPAKPLDALPELNRAIAIDAKSVSARTLRGKLLLQGGRPGQAVTDLRLAHKMAPYSRSAIYNLARAYSALGQAQEAKSLFAQLNTTAPDVLSELSDRRLRSALNQ
jgi:lipopolysaccharide biosynthesis regulator YciM